MLMELHQLPETLVFVSTLTLQNICRLCVYLSECMFKTPHVLTSSSGPQFLSSSLLTKSNISVGLPAAVGAPCCCPLSNLAVWFSDRTEDVRQSVAVPLHASVSTSWPDLPIKWGEIMSLIRSCVFCSVLEIW